MQKYAQPLHGSKLQNSVAHKSRPRHLRQGLEDRGPLGMQRHADGRSEDQTAVTQHLDVESKAGVAWVPARPKRRVGRDGPKLGAA